MDGTCLGERLITFSTAPALLGLELPATLVGCTVLTALALAFAVPRASPITRCGAYLCGGVVAWTLLYAAGAWSHLSEFGAIAVALGVAALVCGWPLVGARRSPTPERFSR